MILVLALVVGLLVYVVLRLQMIGMELNWLRRYIVRLLTKELANASPPPAVHDPGAADAADAAVDAFAEPHDANDDEDDDIELQVDVLDVAGDATARVEALLADRADRLDVDVLDADDDADGPAARIEELGSDAENPAARIEELDDGA